MYDLTTLDNGLRILTATLPYVQSVGLGFFLSVGSRYEPDSLAGASHFIEHMLFKGTPTRPTARDIAEAIEGKGGLFNASTGVETTLYWAKVAAAHLPEALDVLSDMLLHASFDPIEVEKERAVIAEEIAYSLDAPDSLAQIRAGELQWPNHPLGREVAGSRESVAALRRDDLLAFRAAHYRPERTILALAGRVEHREIVAWAEEHLADWEPGRPPTWEPAPPDSRGPRLHTEFKETEQAHLCFSFAGLPRDDPDYFALRLLNVILGEGMRSRLFQEVRERLGLAYSIDSYLSAWQDAGAVGIYAGTAASQTQAVVRAVLGELDRLRREPVPPEELRTAREMIQGRIALLLEDSFAVASWYAQQELLSPEVLEPEEVMARFAAVRPEDIQRLAQRLFRAERLNLAIVGPFGGEEPVDLSGF